MKKISISIITATFNDKQSLLETSDSIKKSTFKDIEWIVIDGNSTDGTLELLQSNNTNIDKWVSEPDDGIYDAWNKGISLATGEWVVFLGAGDLLDSKWFDNFMCTDLTRYDLVYGDIELTFPDDGASLGKKYGLAWGKAVNQVKCSMCLPHPGMLHRKTLFDSDKFSTTYKIVGDWEFFLKIRTKVRAALYCEEISQATVPLGGISTNPKSIEHHFSERMKLMREYQVEGCWLQNAKWAIKRYIAKHTSLFELLQRANWGWRR